MPDNFRQNFVIVYVSRDPQVLTQGYWKVVITCHKLVKLGHSHNLNFLLN